MDRHRLLTAACMLVGIIAVGTIGYAIVEDMPVFDALYMTIITMSTVGFSEIKPLTTAGRMLTIGIIVTGISVLTYTAGRLMSMLIEGELQQLYGRRKLVKNIEKMRDHYIICGYGRIGRIICKELAADKIPFVVVDESPEKADDLEQAGYLYLNLDATREDTLKAAGIDRARGLVTAVQSDANNVFITLTAKGLRPDLFVLARASEEQNQTKLIRAGVSRVICPYQIGGKRMAQVLTRPTVMDFIDNATTDHPLGLVMEEAVLGPATKLTGRTIVDSNLRKDYGVIVVAIKRRDGEMVFNPRPSEQLREGDILVFIGQAEDIGRLKTIL